MPSSEYTARLLSIAEQDLVELVSYLVEESPPATAEVLNHIEARLRALAAHPFTGRVLHDPKLTALGYRVLVVDNYLAFYKVRGKIILVYRILHGARDIMHLLSE